MHSNLVLPISWKLLLAQRNSMAALPTCGVTWDTLPFKMLPTSGQNPRWSNNIFRWRNLKKIKLSSVFVINWQWKAILCWALYLFTITQVVTSDKKWEPNLFYLHFRTLFVSVVIIYDISRGLELKSLTCNIFARISECCFEMRNH